MKTEIKIGDTIVMPEPKYDDIWHIGGFLADVQDILENGNLIVEDQDSDFFEIEKDRVELYLPEEEQEEIQEKLIAHFNKHKNNIEIPATPFKLN